MTVSARRLLTTGLRASLSPRAGVGRFPHRVWPRYVDLNRHMNQAAYAEVMELSRWAWIVRSGLFTTLLSERITPVVGRQSIEYRRELRPLVGFVVDTRAVAFHRRALRVEQHFVVGARVHATGVVDLVFLRGGRVVEAEVLRAAASDLIRPALGIQSWR
ncbi:MAG: acyl-CoA thioesterase FadM, partial [Myxococcota bacterium]